MEEVNLLSPQEMLEESNVFIEALAKDIRDSYWARLREVMLSEELPELEGKKCHE